MTSDLRESKDAAAPRGFHIRPLTGADFKELLRYDWSPLVVERDTVYLFLSRDHGRYCLVAEDEESRALGYLISARSSDGEAAFIFQVHVRKRARRRGVGSALVGELEKTARGGGADLVWFLAREEAQGFYSKLGYRPSGELLDPEALRYVTDVKRTTVMAKRLSDAPPGRTE
ncbi:MAG: GNAT family N-acetyltransferase [Planctomycetota bacterium]